MCLDDVCHFELVLEYRLTMSCKYDDFWFPVEIADNGTILQASNSFYLPQYKDDETVQDFPDEFGL